MAHVAAIARRRSAPARHPLDLRFFHLVWLFMLCSFVGLIGETVVSFLLDGHWESRAGYVLGPLSPIYGLGAVLMTAVLNPVRDRDVALQFALGALVGGSLEYFAGWFFETRYGIVAWSYADQPLNLHGHTCAYMMIVWGILGVVWTTRILHHVVNLIEKMPEAMRKPLTMLAFTYIMFDSALTLACLDSWFLRSAGYPVENLVHQFCARYFNDDFMSTRFETMSMWTSLATR